MDTLTRIALDLWALGYIVETAFAVVVLIFLAGMAILLFVK